MCQLCNKSVQTRVCKLECANLVCLLERIKMPNTSVKIERQVGDSSAKTRHMQSTVGNSACFVSLNLFSVASFELCDFELVLLFPNAAEKPSLVSRYSSWLRDFQKLTIEHPLSPLLFSGLLKASSLTSAVQWALGRKEQSTTIAVVHEYKICAVFRPSRHEATAQKPRPTAVMNSGAFLKNLSHGALWLGARNSFGEDYCRGSRIADRSNFQNGRAQRSYRLGHRFPDDSEPIWAGGGPEMTESDQPASSVSFEKEWAVESWKTSRFFFRSPNMRRDGPWVPLGKRCVFSGAFEILKEMQEFALRSYETWMRRKQFLSFLLIEEIFFIWIFRLSLQ